MSGTRFKPRYKICTRIEENIWPNKKFTSFKNNKWASILRYTNSQIDLEGYLRSKEPGLGEVPTLAGEYGDQLRARQAIKAFYGLKEKKFKKIFRESNFDRRRSQKTFLGLLERRLDIVLVRTGLANTIFQAKQRILHGFYLINGKKIKSPSYRIKNGEILQIKEIHWKKVYEDLNHRIEKNDDIRYPPDYLLIDFYTLNVIFLREPSINEVIYPWHANIKLVREYYR